jgi:hypothetical protein
MHCERLTIDAPCHGTKHGSTVVVTIHQTVANTSKNASSDSAVSPGTDVSVYSYHVLLQLASTTVAQCETVTSCQ